MYCVALFLKPLFKEGFFPDALCGRRLRTTISPKTSPALAVKTISGQLGFHQVYNSVVFKDVVEVVPLLDGAIAR